MRTLATLAALLLAAACPRAEPAQPSPAAPAASTPPTQPAAPAQPAQPPQEEGAGVTVLDSERTCTADSDCALTTADCCPCTALGKQVAVRKDKMEALNARRAPICSAVSCAQAISDDPSCSANSAACKDGMCVPATAGAGAGVGVEPIR